MNLRNRWRFLKTQYGFRRAPLLTAMRLISWTLRCLLQREVVINLRKWRTRILLQASWRGLGKFVFVFRENYEPELLYLKSFLAPGKTFVDVGANVGIYTVLASSLVGEKGRVVAFEPTARSFEALQRNIALNRFTNALAFQVALSEKAGTAWLHYGTDPVRNSLGKDPSWDGGGEEVLTETLDDVLRGASVEHVDILKIDAEGAEELVLRGSSGVLSSMRPIVIYEINPEASSHLGLSEHGATNLLEAFGYDFYVDGQPGTSRPADSPGYFNVLAIPRALKAQ